jgi:hypothetical protein
MDVLGAFLKDRCVVSKDAMIPAGQLYSEYETWCERTGERPLSQQKLGGALADRQASDPGATPDRRPSVFAVPVSQTTYRN